MSDELKKSERLRSLNSEFRRLIDFHAASFKEIDDKARYWLTAALPAFLALAGYLTKNMGQLGLEFTCAGFALATCLLVSVYLFAQTLISLHVQSGVLAPKSRSFSAAASVLDSDEEWKGLLLKQTEELLQAIKNNEAQNNCKSKRLKRAEISLFLAAPTAVCLGAGAAFSYAAAGPFFTATPPTVAPIVVYPGLAAGAGAVIGGLTVATFLVVSHYRTRFKNASSDHSVKLDAQQ